MSSPGSGRRLEINCNDNFCESFFAGRGDYPCGGHKEEAAWGARICFISPPATPSSEVEQEEDEEEEEVEDEEEDEEEEEEENLLSGETYLAVAALAGRKIEGLFVFWSPVAAAGRPLSPRESNLQVNSSPSPLSLSKRCSAQSAEKCNTWEFGSRGGDLQRALIEADSQPTIFNLRRVWKFENVELTPSPFML